jgi:integrase
VSEKSSSSSSQTANDFAQDSARSDSSKKVSLKERLSRAGVGQFVTLESIAPCGALQARILRSGAVQFYWRYTLQGKSSRELLGLYDPSLPPKQRTPSPTGGLTIPGAAAKAAELALVHQAWTHRGGYRAYLSSQRAEPNKPAEVASKGPEDISLKKLLQDFWEWQKRQGRECWRQVRSAVTLHVIEAHPDIAARPANAVTKDDFQVILAGMLGQGIGREMNKLLAYVRAAYNWAASAPAGSAHVLPFHITANPVAGVKPDGSYNRAAKRPLSREQLRTYWRCIANIPGIRGAALRSHLLLGGQRPAQLVRLQTSDMHDDHLKLLDKKGRPGRFGPREHLLPTGTLLPADLALLRSNHPYAISTSGGKTKVAATTLAQWAKDAVGDAIPGFQLKDVRSGVETLLARCRVSRESRGQLQSHGRGGVQEIHYDDFNYLTVKLEALQILRRALVEAEPVSRERPASRPSVRVAGPVNRQGGVTPLRGWLAVRGSRLATSLRSETKRQRSPSTGSSDQEPTREGDKTAKRRSSR